MFGFGRKLHLLRRTRRALSLNFDCRQTGTNDREGHRSDCRHATNFNPLMAAGKAAQHRSQVARCVVIRYTQSNPPRQLWLKQRVLRFRLQLQHATRVGEQFQACGSDFQVAGSA